jgi:hypothetical protein
MFLITKVGGNCIAAFVDLVERICWRERCNAENTPRLVQGAYMQLKGVMHRLQPNLSHKIDRSLRKVSISADAKAGFGRELGYRQQAERSHDLGCESIRQPVV